MREATVNDLCLGVGSAPPPPGYYCRHQSVQAVALVPSCRARAHALQALLASQARGALIV